MESLRTTPTLAQVIQDAMERRVAEIHTMMPGEVVLYNPLTNIAAVKPQLKKKFVTEAKAREIPMIAFVPVWVYRTATAHFRLPIAKGDTGMLLFSERSLDNWLIKGGDVDPEDPRKHALTDAVFLPGLFPMSKPMTGRSSMASVEIQNGLAFLELKPEGKFRIGNQVEELLGLLNDILSALKSLTVQDTGTPSVPAGVWPLTVAAQGQLTALSTRLGSLKA